MRILDVILKVSQVLSLSKYIQADHMRNIHKQTKLNSLNTLKDHTLYLTNQPSMISDHRFLQTMAYFEFSNLSMSSPTFWASLCGCAPGTGGVRLGFGFGGGGGAGKGLQGAGGILLGFLSCPRASRCAGLGGTTDAGVQTRREEQSERDAWGSRHSQKQSGDTYKSQWENLHGWVHELSLLVSW